MRFDQFEKDEDIESIQIRAKQLGDDEDVQAYVQAVSANTLSRLKQHIPRWEAHFSDAFTQLSAASDEADPA